MFQCTKKRELLHIYKLYIRSIIEQSSVVWSAALTKEEQDAFERCQKISLKLIYKSEYVSYENALSRANIPKISERFEMLRLKFAIKCTQNEKTKHMFPINTAHSEMQTRKQEVFKVPFASHSRMQNSALIVMSKQLNEYIFERSEVNGSFALIMLKVDDQLSLC